MTPRTEAGRRLFEFWRLHQRVVHNQMDIADALPDDIAAVLAIVGD